MKPPWNELLEYVCSQHKEYAFIAGHAKDPAKKLAAECRELAYFDVIKAMDRIVLAAQPATQAAEPRPACTCPDNSYLHKSNCPEYVWKRKVGPQVYDAPEPPAGAELNNLLSDLQDVFAQQSPAMSERTRRMIQEAYIAIVGLNAALRAQPTDGAPVGDMRVAFEQWYRGRWPTMPMKRTGKSGRYDDPGINDEWLSFKRAAEWLSTRADGALRQSLLKIMDMDGDWEDRENAMKRALAHE